MEKLRNFDICHKKRCKLHKFCKELGEVDKVKEQSYTVYWPSVKPRLVTRDKWK